ncbi:MauE/DoxX family redox-associated membrane protein [Streptomyces sp. 184]|uniref:MauE/DoxX family redox-associated membrane protein n=1 Tax=Streptomyces sp. 184 TaxID=1827526 RepID=UPI0038917F94
MQAAGLLLLLPVSGVLLWAGLEKLRMRAEFARTLSGIGFTGRTRRALILLVPATELLVAGALLITPSAMWTRYAVGALGLAFAAAGAMALRAERVIECSCFGAGGRALGRRQIVLLPVWLGVAAALQLTGPSWSATAGVRGLAGVLVAICVLRAVSLAHVLRAAVGYRRAIDESARVLKPLVTARIKEPETL